MLWLLSVGIAGATAAIEATSGSTGTSNWQATGNIATILIAFLTLLTLAYVIQQTRALIVQAETSLQHLREYTERSRLDLAYQLVLRFGDPEFNHHVYEAMKVLDRGDLSKDVIMELFHNRDKEFRYDFRIMSNFMESLAYMYEQNHADRDVIWNIFYGIVIGYYKSAENSGIIDGLREEYGKYGKGVLAKWEWLAREFERKGEPH